MLVDHERVLARLKGEIAAKPSHGQRDLLSTIARLEADCMVDETEYQRFVRRYTDELGEAFLNVTPGPGDDDPLTPAAASAGAMDGRSPLTDPHEEDDRRWTPQAAPQTSRPSTSASGTTRSPIPLAS